MPLGTLLLRTDAGPGLGTGHLMRCLALAVGWQRRGGRACFALGGGDAAVASRITGAGCEIQWLGEPPGSPADAVATAWLAQRLEAAWVVVDGYHFDDAFEATVRSAGSPVLAVDDDGHAAHEAADILLNGNLHAIRLPVAQRPRGRALLGPAFALLRGEFTGWQNWERQFSPESRRALATFGGSDPARATERAVAGLRCVATPLEARIVVGALNPRRLAVEGAIAAEPRHHLTLLVDVTQMAPQMAWADIAITAAGSTCWELACLGVPMVAGSVAANQVPIAASLAEAGIADLVDWHAGGADAVAARIEALLADVPRRRVMSSRARALVDGRGVERTIDALLSYSLTRGNRSDARAVLRQ
jgi:UDP-2,4-diacetamido-2,4,6-trideoxy-beta-L-altropyranose hydrolase